MSTPSSDRIRWIEHKGKRILLHDFSHITNPFDVLPAVEASRAIVAVQPKGSLLALTDVTGSRFNKEIVDALKSLANHNKPFVKAGAVVGLSGLQRVVYVAITQFTGRRLPTFETAEQAMDWLVEQ
ncbi:MAG TPA: hypothetical protein VNL98_06660 [Gemmatimonadales bacterium]|nr:hypothetical protein [Gemmatimonadales bacterium]